MRLLLIALLAAVIQQNPQNLGGTIEGVVNRAGTNFPIAGAQIKASTFTANSSKAMPFAEMTTDGAGRFIFREVPPGSYAIEVSADGYVFGVPPRLNPTFATRLVLGPGQRVQIPVPGMQAATLRGRVVDAEGRGMADMVVEILESARNAKGQPVLRSIPGLYTGIRTDERGEYEKTMLLPGQYSVRTVVERPDTPKTWVYSPETTDPDAAKTLDLREGSDTTADIRIGPAIDIDTYRISGRVRPVPENGSPVVVILRQKVDLSSNRLFAGEGNPRTFTESQGKTGKFEFRGIRMGTYELYATAPVDGKEQLVKTVIEVRNLDVEDVELVMRPGLDIKGRLVIEDEPKDLRLVQNSSFSDDSRDPNRSHAGDVRISLNRQDGLFSETVFRPVIDDKGTSFTFHDVPEGDYEIAVSFVGDGQPPSPDLYVVDVRATGRSVFDNGFQVGVDPVDAMEVIVGTQGGSVKGTVTGSANAPAVLLVTPDPLRTRTAPYRLVPVGIGGKDQIELRGLRPGNYKMFAVPAPDWTRPGQPGNEPMLLYLGPEFFSPYESKAVVVVVRKGSTTSGVQVPFIPSGK